MKTAHIHMAMLSLLALVLLSCKSTDKLLHEGEYDEVIERLLKKIEGKNHLKTAQVKDLERAFRNYTSGTLRDIERLNQRGRAVDYEEVLRLAGDMKSYQDMIWPFLPVISKDGYRARIAFTDIDPIIREAESNFADALYHEAGELLTSARNNDKVAAREAYSMLDRYLDYESSPEVRQMRQEARALGTVRVLVTYYSNTYDRSAEQLSGAILSAPEYHEDGWIEFVYDPEEGRLPLDYEARLTISEVRIGNNRMRVEETPRTRRIRDGWEYVLDSRGNVAKDSLGNDIRRERYINITGVAVRTFQEKDSRTRGIVEIIDLRSGGVVHSRNITTDWNYRNTARSYYGDGRALPSNERVHEPIETFPGDVEVLDRLRYNLGSRFGRIVDKFFKVHS